MLEAAGFEVADIVSETVEFSAQDLMLAWESNSKAAGHAAVRYLSAQELGALKDAYLDALTRKERELQAPFKPTFFTRSAAADSSFGRVGRTQGWRPRPTK